MKTLTITLVGGESVFFHGETREECLEKASQRLNFLADSDLDGVSVLIAYKETITIVNGEDGWAIEYCENGCGTVTFFDSRQDAIDEFVSKIGVFGEHWSM